MRASDVSALAFAVCSAVACSGANETELFGAAPSGTPSTSAPPSGTSGSASGETSSGDDAGSSGTNDAGASSGGVPDAARPARCRPGDPDGCGPDEYCRVEGCAVTGGVCTKRATFQAGAYEPVCGCDRVTYWNKELASARGANIAASGPCPAASALHCNEQTKCPGGAHCSMALSSRPGCLTDVVATGLCWVLPASCPPVTAQRARDCDANRCMSLCEAIKAETRFYPVASCTDGGG